MASSILWNTRAYIGPNGLVVSTQPALGSGWASRGYTFRAARYQVDTPSLNSFWKILRFSHEMVNFQF